MQAPFGKVRVCLRMILSLFATLTLLYTQLGRAAEVASPTGDGGAKGGSKSPMKSLKDIPDDSEIAKAVKQKLPDCVKQQGGNGDDCKVEDMGQVGDAAHQAKKSCHNYKPPKAWDIGVVDCGGQKWDPKDQEKYLKLVECVVGNGQGGGSPSPSPAPSFMDRVKGAVSSIADKLHALFDKAGVNVSTVPNHKDHMHVEEKGCMANAPGGGGSGDGKKDAMNSFPLLDGYVVRGDDEEPQTTSLASYFEQIKSKFARWTNEILPFAESYADLSETIPAPDFTKVIDAPAVGKVRVEYKDWNDPMRDPATLSIYVQCDGAHEEVLAYTQSMCRIRSTSYQKETKTVKVGMIGGRVDSSAAFCDIVEDKEFDVGKACHEYWRKKLSARR